MQKIALIKRVPGYKSIILLILLSGFAEGFGISTLVPVVSYLTSATQSLSTIPSPFNKLVPALISIGIDPSFEVLLALTLLLMVLSFAMVYYQQCVAAMAQLKFLEKLRGDAVESLFNSNWPYLAKVSSGQSSNTIITESERGVEAIMALINLLANAFLLLVYMTFAMLLSWKLFLIAGITIFSAAIFGRRLIRKVRETGKSRVDMNSKYHLKLVEYIRAIKLVKATSLKGEVLSRLAGPNRETAHSLKEIIISSARMRFELQSIISIAMVLILYVAIKYLSIQVSKLLVFMYIVMRLAPKFSTLQGQYHSFSAHYPAISILDNLLQDTIENKESLIKGTKLKEFNGNIEFKNISYQYPNTQFKSLRNLSFKIQNKQFIAFVGKSGSGKTTLIDMIMGLLRPSYGELLIAGQNAELLDLESLREHIGLVSQDSHFFTGTIQDNLTIGTQLKDEKHILNCLEVAQLKKFVTSLPLGLNTIIGEGGINLSGGQNQRLAIARALIRKPSILILDEATSSLDKESEYDFQSAIEKIAHNYTIIAVAHKIETIKHADSIYFMQEGQIAESGSYKELMEKAGAFFDLQSSYNR